MDCFSWWQHIIHGLCDGLPWECISWYCWAMSDWLLPRFSIRLLFRDVLYRQETSWNVSFNYRCYRDFSPSSLWRCCIWTLLAEDFRQRSACWNWLLSWYPAILNAWWLRNTAVLVVMLVMLRLSVLIRSCCTSTKGWRET